MRLRGGVISGTSSIVQMDAWHWKIALVKNDGIHVNFPSAQKKRMVGRTILKPTRICKRSSR
jgi:hypothetical protein